MPIEQVRKQPARLLLFVPFPTLSGYTSGQLLDKSLNPARTFIYFFRSSTFLGCRTRHRSPLRFETSTQSFQPIAQLQSGQAIIAVVAFDGSMDIVGNSIHGAKFQRAFDNA